MRAQTRTSSIYSADDPLAQALRPPTTESEEEKQARLVAEQEAKRVSDQIDDEIREERERKKKQSMEVKVCVRSLLEVALRSFTGQVHIWTSLLSMIHEPYSMRWTLRVV